MILFWFQVLIVNDCMQLLFLFHVCHVTLKDFLNKTLDTHTESWQTVCLEHATVRRV